MVQLLPVSRVRHLPVVVNGIAQMLDIIELQIGQPQPLNIKECMCRPTKWI